MGGSGRTMPPGVSPPAARLRPPQQQSQATPQQQPPPRPNFGRPPPPAAGTTPQSSSIPKTAPAPGGAAPIDSVVDITKENFARYVGDPTPLILDAWAPWCGPCRSLTPLLEAAVRASKGAVRLGKINTDVETQLARELRVTQLPTVFGVVQGKIVDQFIGLQPESAIKDFVARLAAAGSARGGGRTATDPLEAALASVDDALAVLKEPMTFSPEEMTQIRQVLKEGAGFPALPRDASRDRLDLADDLRALSLAGLVRCALLDGDTVAAGEVAGVLRSKVGKSRLELPEVKSALAAAALAAPAVSTPTTAVGGAPATRSEQGLEPTTIESLRTRVSREPGDSAARYELAKALFAKGETREAVDEALVLLRRDRTFRDGAPRTLLIQMFDAVGDSQTDLVKEARRRMSSILLN